MLGAQGDKVVLENPRSEILADRVEVGSNQLKATNMKMAYRENDASAMLPPKLQFPAWQDGWKTNASGAARHPEGSPVTNATELGWLKQVHPGGIDVSEPPLLPS
jgi:hypothetical protein